MSTTPIDPRAMVRFVRQCGPVTAMEALFAFTYPTEEFAERALRVSSDVTGELNECAGYWTATVAEQPAQGE